MSVVSGMMYIMYACSELMKKNVLEYSADHSYYEQNALEAVAEESGYKSKNRP